VSDKAKPLYEALRWLVNLHHGVSRGGTVDPETGRKIGVTDREWKAALDAGKAALAEYGGRSDVDEYNEAYDLVWGAINDALDEIDDDKAPKPLDEDTLLIRRGHMLLQVSVSIREARVTPV